MAKILPGPLGVEPRGKLGGVVFSRNRYGLYVRVKSSPVNPNSPRQNSIRASFGAITTRWRDTLTPVQREAWCDYADETKKADVHGNLQALAGNAMYIGFNVPWTNIGETAVDDGPVTPGVGPMLSVTLTGNTTDGVQLTAFSPALELADRILILKCAAVVSQARDFYNGPWTQWGYPSGQPAIPMTLVASGDVAIGQRWYFRFRALISDGRTGPPTIGRADILV